MFLFLHIPPWVCVFSMNHLQCSGHPWVVLGVWGFSKLSGDETSREEARRAELAGCSPPARLLGSVRTVSYRFRRMGSNPWWGLWVPGHDPLPAAVSLFPLMSWGQWSFWDPRPSRQRLQDIPWRLSGELPPRPRSETLLRPTAQGVLLSTSPRELPADGGETPSLRLRGLQVFSLWVVLLTQDKYRSLLCPLSHKTQDDTDKPQLTLGSW